MKNMIYIIAVIIVSLLIFLYWKYPDFIKRYLTIFLAAVTVFSLIYAKIQTDLAKIQINLAKKQIDEMQKMKDEDKQIAIDSLVGELGQNKAWVQQFIHDCEEGSHLGKNDQYSWVWNPPKSNAYEKYLTIACSGDKELSTKIINLYSRLESCGVILNSIHELLNNSSKVNDSETAAIIIKNNKNIENFCSEIQNSFDEPIKKLKAITNHANLSKTLSTNKEGPELISSGTAASSVIIYKTRIFGQDPDDTLSLNRE